MPNRMYIMCSSRSGRAVSPTRRRPDSSTRCGDRPWENIGGGWGSGPGRPRFVLDTSGTVSECRSDIIYSSIVRINYHVCMHVYNIIIMIIIIHTAICARVTAAYELFMRASYCCAMQCAGVCVCVNASTAKYVFVCT